MTTYRGCRHHEVESLIRQAMGDHMYGIVFDLLDGNGCLAEPLFAEVIEGGVPALSPDLEHAARFADEEQAAAFLWSAYGPKYRDCGTVMEIGEAA